MPRAIRITVLGAVTLVAAFWLGGCSADPQADPHPAATSDATTAPSPAASPPPAAAPLPPPEELTDVLYRLADANVPGAEKTGIIEDATAGDAVALDRFGNALRDGGYLPAEFEVTDLAWSEQELGNVVATVIVGTTQPDAGQFTFPMEFAPTPDGGWQLTRETANLLLEAGETTPATPPR